MGNLNLLQVVTKAKAGFAKRGGMQLLSLLMKTDVHCVWLANGGRERLTTRGLLLTNYSEMHGISLANVVSCIASTFQLIRKAKPQKKKKMRAKMVAKEKKTGAM